MAKTHPNLHRVYRDFYPRSYIEPLIGFPSCFLSGWHLKEGQQIMERVVAGTFLVYDIFDQAIRQRVLVDPKRIIIESNGHPGLTVISAFILGRMLVLDTTGWTGPAAIESYAFREMINSTRLFSFIVTMLLWRMPLERITALLKEHSSKVKILPITIPNDANLVGLFPRQVQSNDIIHWQRDGSVLRAGQEGALVQSSPSQIFLFCFQDQ